MGARAHDLKPMLKPYDPTSMVAYAVTRAVNSVKNSWLTRCLTNVPGSTDRELRGFPGCDEAPHQQN